MAFVLLYREPFRTLLSDWWNDPDADHGLLLGPPVGLADVEEGAGRGPAVPALGEGLMHYTEGWVIFVFAFAIIGMFAWVMTWIEAVSR